MDDSKLIPPIHLLSDLIQLNFKAVVKRTSFDVALQITIFTLTITFNVDKY